MTSIQIDRHPTLPRIRTGVLGVCSALMLAGCSQQAKECSNCSGQAAATVSTTQPAAPARHVRFLDPENGPKGAGWVELFNHRDLAGWHLRYPDQPNSWTVADGILHNRGPGVDLVTDEKFWNFEAYYEYRVPRGSNSGFYLRGRYEIQIYDSFGKKAEAHQDGSLYGLKAPTTNVSREAEQWQSVYARIVDKKVTVILNGQKIIDAFEVTRATGAEIDQAYDKSGPIFLQGDHGTVDFRYVFVRPLP